MHVHVQVPVHVPKHVPEYVHVHMPVHVSEHVHVPMHTGERHLDEKHPSRGGSLELGDGEHMGVLQSADGGGGGLFEGEGSINFESFCDVVKVSQPSKELK